MVSTERIEVRLGEICHLSSGFTTRGRLEPAPSGGLPAIQLRDVQGDDEVNSGNLHRYLIGDLPARYLVRGGEVIFRSRGEPNTATVVSASLGEPAVVILPLIIIRPNRDVVLPEYLAWAINQPDVQRRLDAKAQGTSLRMISKAVLEQIDIPLPDLDTQGRIVAIHTLAKHESSLLRELAERRARLTSLILTEQARLAHQKGPLR